MEFTISGVWIITVMINCVRYSYMRKVGCWSIRQLRQTTKLFALQATVNSWANRLVELRSNMYDSLTVTVYVESGSRRDTLWGEELRPSVIFSRDRRTLRNLKIDKFGHPRNINFLSSSVRTESVGADCTHSKLRCYNYMQQVSSDRYSSILALPNLKSTQTTLRTVRSFWNDFVKLGLWWINTLGFSVSKCWSWT